MRKLISVFFLFSITQVFSQSAAIVLFTAQKVTAQNGTNVRPIVRGQSLDEGDVIATAANSAARIRFLNGTLVTLGANSSYKIVSYNPTSDVVINAELTKGTLQSQTVNAKKREALKTPVIALAITGTKYNVYVSSPIKTNVQVINGIVEANGRAFGAGKSFVATPRGVSAAPFPAAGAVVITPKMLSSDTQELTALASIKGSEAGVTTEVAIEDAESLGFLASTAVASTMVNSLTATVTGLDAMAAFQISCYPNQFP